VIGQQFDADHLVQHLERPIPDAGELHGHSHSQGVGEGA